MRAFFGIRFLAGAFAGAGFFTASVCSAPRRREVEAAGEGRRFSSVRFRELARAGVPVLRFVV